MMNIRFSDDDKEKKAKSDALLNKLLKIRTLFISDVVTKELADTFMKQLLILADDDPEKPIDVFIDTPGGDADVGFAIYDILRFVPNQIRTIAVGLTASAGTIILLGADKGNRYSLPNSRILIHQPSSGIRGTASDISIQAEAIRKLKARGNELISRETGQPLEKVARDTERDFWMSPQEAKEYGLINHIISSRSELK